MRGCWPTRGRSPHSSEWLALGLPDEPEGLVDPKLALVGLCRHSSSASIRRDIVPPKGTPRRVGPGVWTKTAKILSPSATNFGNSVSLSDNGSTLLMGAPGATPSSTATSAAYFFTRDASVAWSYKTSVTTGIGGVPTGAAVLVGAPGVDSVTSGTTTTYRAGAGYLFSSGGSMPTLFSATVGSSAYTGARLGASVGISPDGLSVVLGAPRSTLGNERGGGGIARLWKNTTGTWPTGSGSTVSPSGLSGDQYGTSVSVANNGRVAIGALGKTVSGMSSAGTA